jgi:hypothetical protein
VQAAAFRVEVEEGGEDVRVGVGGELEGAGVELCPRGERVREPGGRLDREGEGEVGRLGEEGMEAEGVEVQAGGGEGAQEERGEVGEEEVQAQEAAVDVLDGERWELAAGADAGE